MSDSTAFDFSKFVPGFDFLKQLSGAGAQANMPTASSWIAPTLDPEELDKRIQELKTVHFWLDQNTKAVSATIQALEVQRMTLATLRGMNLSMNELAESLKIKPESMSSMFTPAAGSQASTSAPEEEAPSTNDSSPPAGPAESTDSITPPAGVDPMAWWGSLTQQFQQIAQQAMTDIQRSAPPASGSGTAPAQPKDPKPRTQTPGATGKKASAKTSAARKSAASSPRSTRS
jgi:hypothetical protein